MRPIDEKLLTMDDPSGEKWSLTANKCRDCATIFHPARYRCANCTSANLEPLELAKEGELISFSQVHQTHPDALVHPPYWVGLIRLDKGPIIEAIAPGETEAGPLRVGERVKLTLVQLADADDGEKIVSYGFQRRNGKEAKQ
jgi:uncharacterized OB-fold protein